MGVQAIIMAGGEGTRLRPLTCGMPKPLMPVLDQPVMGYALQLLKRHRVREAGATLFYLPESIRQRFGEGDEWGLGLRYWEEEKPVGTAGSVRQAMDALEDTFFVLSGDGLTDCDLSAAMDFHKRSGALATLVMKRVPVPLEYGVVITGGGGQIQRFVEKPGWGEVFSDTVNTGIYILQKDVLKLVPTDRPYDFGRDLFPLLVREKQPIYGWVMDGYWCDIGGQEAYVQAQIDLLEGRVDLAHSAHADAWGNCVAPSARVSPDAVLDGPCWIGEGARVAAGARIGLHAILGPDTKIEPGASIKQSVLWRGAQIGARAQVRGAVIGENAQVGGQARLFEGSALGDGSTLGPGAQLSPGVKVWPGKQVAEGLRLHANLVWGEGAHWTVDGSGVVASTPEQAAMLGAAWARAAKVTEMALMASANATALAQYAAVSAGLIAQGVRVTLLGEGTVPMLRSVQRMLSLPAGIYVHGTRLEMTGAMGCAPSRDLQRGVEALSVRQDYPQAFAREAVAPRTVQDACAFYIGALAAQVRCGTLAEHAPPVAVFTHSEAQRALAVALLEALHLRQFRVLCTSEVRVEEEETGFLLSEEGESVTAFDARFVPEEGAQTLLRCAALLEGGIRELIVPAHAPRALEGMAQTAHCAVRRVKSAREAMMQALLDAETVDQQERLWQMDMHFDGLCAMAGLIGLLAQRRATLQQILQKLPQVHRVSREIPCAQSDKGRILRALAEEAEHADLTDGLCVDFEEGWALLIPAADRAILRVLGEGTKMEFAQELCERYVRKVGELQQSQDVPPVPGGMSAKNVEKM